MNDPVATPQVRPAPVGLLAPRGGLRGDLPERPRLGYSHAGPDRYRLERLDDLRLVSRAKASQQSTRRRKMIRGVEVLLPGLAILGCLDVLWSTGVI
jgi:hypothetical protein